MIDRVLKKNSGHVGEESGQYTPGVLRLIGPVVVPRTFSLAEVDPQTMSNPLAFVEQALGLICMHVGPAYHSVSEQQANCK